MRNPASSRIRLAVSVTLLAFGCTGPVHELAPDPQAQPAGETIAPPMTVGTRPFGSLSAAMAPRVNVFGNIEGLLPGRGFSVWMPPLMPVQTIGAYTAGLGVGLIVASPILLLEAGLGGDGSGAVELAGEIGAEVTAALLEGATFHSGLEDVLRPYTFGVLSDFSMELGFEGSYHSDDLHGGRASHHAILLGLRMAGPRTPFPRLYAAGGGGWHWLDFDNRPSEAVPGLYGSVGAEIFNASGSASIGAEIRGHLLLGVDSAGVEIDAGFTAFSVTTCFYWW